jgi:hypothetical protein
MIDRIFFNSEEENIIIFNVDRPITFGHSQLRFSFNKNNNYSEAECFIKVHLYIDYCLKVFDRIYRMKKFHERKDLECLAKETFTEGEFLKTLILRTSASEDHDCYKIHLIPYFESHAKLCKVRYNSIYNNNKEGGLLGWLGDRETIVDTKEVLLIDDIARLTSLIKKENTYNEDALSYC